MKTDEKARTGAMNDLYPACLLVLILYLCRQVREPWTAEGPKAECKEE